MKNAFAPDLDNGSFLPGLRVKRVQATRDVWEMTWAPDDRATLPLRSLSMSPSLPNYCILEPERSNQPLGNRVLETDCCAANCSARPTWWPRCWCNPTTGPPPTTGTCPARSRRTW